MGKAAIYNPYLDTLGGGERYTLSFAKVLAEELGFNVDLEWKNRNIKNKLQERFGLKIPDNINFVKDIKRGEGYDLCFWVSDGSIPTLRARKNILHFQVPFKDVGGNSLLNKMKLFRINKIVCNSQFTKNVIDREFGVNSSVLYPPVDVDSFKPKIKEKLICYVGRFSQLTQNKGQEFLIEAFAELAKNNFFNDWKLVLAGGAEVGAGNNISLLREKAEGLNVDILESPDFKTLKDLYGKAKIFWSAAGYGVNEEKNPANVEHFGISLIEAMASGCAPVVFHAGGHKEIIEDGKNGFLWKTKSEILKITNDLISKKHELINISREAKQTSKKFSYQLFSKKVGELV